MAVTHPAVTNGLTLNYDPDGDHSYPGWDRFGRIVEQTWRSTGGSPVDSYTYTYDCNPNPTAKTNQLSSGAQRRKVIGTTVPPEDRILDMLRSSGAWRIIELKRELKSGRRQKETAFLSWKTHPDTFSASILTPFRLPILLE